MARRCSLNFTMQILLKANKYRILLLIFTLLYGTGYLFAAIGRYEHEHSYGDMPADYFILRFGFSVLFAPLVETLVVQHWLIQAARRYLPLSLEWKKWAVAVLLSALVFAAGHTYSVLYVFAAFITGLLFAGTYWLFANRKDMNPILAVYALHFLNNLLNFLWDGMEYWSVVIGT
jgi:hypothetical protein